jgi:hypothetical protein
MKKKSSFVPTTASTPPTHTALKRRLRLLSATDAVISVTWLNVKKGTVAYQRVLAIRNELTELGSMLDLLNKQQVAIMGKPLGNDKEILDWASQAVSHAQLVKQFQERHNILNATIAKYAFLPALAYDLGTGVWCQSFIPRRHVQPINIPDQMITVRVSEAVVVAALSRLASQRELNRVRLCDQCHESWLLSERTIDRFCSSKCRDQANKESPKYRARKAEQQREYRLREKERYRRK